MTRESKGLKDTVSRNFILTTCFTSFNNKRWVSRIYYMVKRQNPFGSVGDSHLKTERGDKREK